ncbi:serine/threonine-protein kinase [Rubellicoccus peritrichatus]|uniref:Serine/threonine-protein kinase n=1 Tax=Rubellicoccus peritrichatus TaxID=3080537 RepID=A0AAQ3L561_9BACT|nr:serine/threonine-protein kinase [Puniceicoccus sp. CR14]WOO39335.1 serine/threonine-protein kinase [Puniceicoccus sp. CR14]
MSNPPDNPSPRKRLEGLRADLLMGQGIGEKTDETMLPVIAGFEVRKLIGRGGMGSVYLAKQISLDREVAVKQVIAKLGNDDAFLDRLEREARIMARMRHPNIVTVHNFERVAGGRATIVMEYIEGGDLRDQINQNPKGMPLASAIKWTQEIADALSKAHQSGVVHRDMKPENILIGHDDVARVTDFGLALPLGENATRLTLTGSTVGTVDYISPESFNASEPDARSDLYSLGVIVYEMLTGKVPRGNFKAPHEVRSEVPVSVSHAVMQTLKSDPNERVQSMDDFLELLKATPRRSMRPISIILILVAVVVGLWMIPWSSKEKETPDSTLPQEKEEQITQSPLDTEPMESTELFIANVPVYGEWINLLSPANKELVRISGGWEISNGEVTTDDGVCILALQKHLPESYDVRTTFVRLSGRYSIAVFFAANGTVGTVDIDGWEDHLSGVQSVDYVDLRRRQNFIFPIENGRRYTLQIEVRPDHVRVLIDDEEKCIFDIGGKELGVVFPWAWNPTPSDASLAIGSYESPTRFEKIEWRAVE